MMGATHAVGSFGSAYCVGKASRYPQTLFCYADELTIEHGELILKKEVRLRGRVNLRQTSGSGV